jgi:hypothetical protein
LYNYLRVPQPGCCARRGSNHWFLVRLSRINYQIQRLEGFAAFAICGTNRDLPRLHFSPQRRGSPDRRGLPTEQPSRRVDRHSTRRFAACHQTVAQRVAIEIGGLRLILEQPILLRMVVQSIAIPLALMACDFDRDTSIDCYFTHSFDQIRKLTLFHHLSRE